MTIRELFALGGEGLFRDRESESLQQAVQQTSSVISLGGGAILREQNRRVLAESGVTIWLNATPETVAQRLQSDGATRDQRPALTALPPMDEIRSVMETRRPIYEQVSQFRVDTDGKTTKEIAQEILSFVTTRS
jgi:shikimate kinase